MTFTFNMAETLAIAIVILLVGAAVKKRVPILERFFIPGPVIGGVIFSIILLIGHETGAFSFAFDGVLKDFLMIAFYTTVGYLASFELLKKGGIGVVLFLLAAIILVVIQNSVGVSLAKIFGLHPYIGLAAGSVPLTGGHGTSGAFGPLMEQGGAVGAMSVAMASATFGLVSGCLIGGPIAKKLIDRFGLVAKKDEKPHQTKREIDNEVFEGDLDVFEEKVSEESLFKAVVAIGLAMGCGAWIPPFAKSLGVAIPVYLGPMLVAAIFRNIMDMSKKKLPLTEISMLGNIALSIFLAMALMSMKLWELAALALPLIAILLIQTVIMAIYAYFVTFNIMGRDYDAAVIACGHCGFGMGATPNAMANMEAFTKANGPSVKAFFVIPLVGSLFIDFFNAVIITFFMNMFK